MNFSELPENLPVPTDDGAAAHLQGLFLPALTLPATDGSNVSLNELDGRWVIYIYPPDSNVVEVLAWLRNAGD